MWNQNDSSINMKKDKISVKELGGDIYDISVDSYGTVIDGNTNIASFDELSFLMTTCRRLSKNHEKCKFCEFRFECWTN